MSNQNSLISIIISDLDSDPDSFILCLQALIANTDLKIARIIIYITDIGIDYNYLEENLILEHDLEIRKRNFNKYSQIFADVSSNLYCSSAIVLLSSNAIVSPGWLNALNEASQTNEDIAMVTSREIRHSNDSLALELIPYAMNTYDIDIAVALTEKDSFDPLFDESNLLIRLSNFKLFCLYFKKNLLELINWQYLNDLDDIIWQNEIIDIVNKTEKLKIVYTSKSKVFHKSYFSLIS